MKTHTLQIKSFPHEINKALKKKAIDQGITFRELVIAGLTALAETTRIEPADTDGTMQSGLAG